MTYMHTSENLRKNDTRYYIEGKRVSEEYFNQERVSVGRVFPVETSEDFYKRDFIDGYSHKTTHYCFDTHISETEE